MGSLVGGFLAVALFAFIIERFAFKDEEPDSRAVKTTGLAYAICAVLSFFTLGPLAPLLYLPGALVVFLWQRRAFNKAWIED